MARQTLLIFCVREDDAPEITGPLLKVKMTGDCEFCNERVIYNRHNYDEQKGKGYRPVLICTVCYGQGEHIRQGYGK